MLLQWRHFISLTPGTVLNTERLKTANKNFLRAGFELATAVLRYTHTHTHTHIYIYIYIAIFYCWYLMNSWNQTDGSYWKRFPIFAKVSSINREHREGTALPFQRSCTCMCTHAHGPVVERSGRTQVQVMFRTSKWTGLSEMNQLPVCLQDSSRCYKPNTRLSR